MQVPNIPMPPEYKDGWILEFDAPLTRKRHDLVVLMLTQVRRGMVAVKEVFAFAGLACWPVASALMWPREWPQKLVMLAAGLHVQLLDGCLGLTWSAPPACGFNLLLTDEQGGRRSLICQRLLTIYGQPALSHSHVSHSSCFADEQGNRHPPQSVRALEGV
jgi:hypothetical protein